MNIRRLNTPSSNREHLIDCETFWIFMRSLLSPTSPSPLTSRPTRPALSSGSAAERSPELVVERKMRIQKIAALAATVATLSIPAAHAQLERPAPSQPSNPRDCPPGVRHAPSSNETGTSRPLSDQRSESKGVICPRAGIDLGISVLPIAGGRTPVIAPPGTPGGDPSIQPK